MQCKKEILTRGAKKYCSYNCYWLTLKGIGFFAGRKHSEKSKEKMQGKRNTKHNKQFYIGYIPWNKGIKNPFPITDEHRKNLSKAFKGRKVTWISSGKDHPAWKGGISKIDKLCRRMKEYIKWRKDIFERDNYTCQECKYTGYVTAHHIKSFSSIIKKNDINTIIEARECNEIWDLNNGLTLCENCHTKTDNYKGRGRLKKLNLINV